MEIELSDIKDMKYLELCIKETLRMYPSIPMIGRTISEDVTIKGVRIPAGTIASCSFYSLHRDEKSFPDPEVFDPDRFLLENSAGRHAYAYLPFSAGSRNCIGQRFGLLEAKVMLSMILRKFKVQSLQRLDQVTLTSDISLKTEETVNLRFSPRHN